MHFFGGLIGIAVGFVLMKYAFTLTQTFGTIDWAEQHMRAGLGGTYSLYRIVGLIVIILSLLYMFNAIGFLVAPLASVFGGAKTN